MSLNMKKKRVPRSEMGAKKYPDFTPEHALDFVISGKRTEGLRERTLRDYEKFFGYFTEWLRENYDITYVADITTDMIRQYINYMKYDKVRYSGHPLIDDSTQPIGLADTTINIHLRVFSALFRYLESEEIIEVNPMERVKLLRTDIDLTNGFTDEEVKALLKVPNTRDYVGFRDYVAMNVMLDCGLRINELLSLRSGDIDINTRFITVSSEVSKNRKQRMVPVSSHVIKLIYQLIEENAKHFRTDRVFLSVYGEHLSDRQLTKRLKYYAEKAGIEAAKVTAHVYRHTWAKNMIMNGCDPFTLQKLGGWSDIRTMRRYIQISDDDLRRSHDEYSPVMNMRNRRK